MKCCVYTRDFLETPYLDFFIEHYVKLGFDKIIILKADDIPYDCPHQYQSNVDIHTVPNLGDQLLPKYDYLVKQSGCDWCLSVDVDEILLLHKQYGCIQDFIESKIQENDKINIFYFRWAMIEKFDIQYPESLSSILDTYQLFSNPHIKSMTKISELSLIYSSHMCNCKTELCIYFEDNHLHTNNPLQPLSKSSYQESILIHLHTRSIHNLIIKSFHTLFHDKQIKYRQEFINFINNIDISSTENIDYSMVIKQYIGSKISLPFSRQITQKINLLNHYSLPVNTYNVINAEMEMKSISRLLQENKMIEDKYYFLIDILHKYENCKIFYCKSSNI